MEKKRRDGTGTPLFPAISFPGLVLLVYLTMASLGCAPAGEAREPCPEKFAPESVFALVQRHDDAARRCLTEGLSLARSKLEREFLERILRQWDSLLLENKPPAVVAEALDVLECVSKCPRPTKGNAFAVVTITVSAGGRLLDYQILRQFPEEPCYTRCIGAYVSAAWYRPAVRDGRFVEGAGSITLYLHARP